MVDKTEYHRIMADVHEMKAATEDLKMEAAEFDPYFRESGWEHHITKEAYILRCKSEAERYRQISNSHRLKWEFRVKNSSSE
jgi:hypothetical protein